MATHQFHHVATSSLGGRVLLGAFERSAVVRDVVSGSRISIDTTFDAGGNRLALSDQSDSVLAGAYHQHGLAAYAVATGRELWRRADVKGTQSVRISVDGLTAFCGVESGPLLQVNVRTGKTHQRVRGATDQWESPFDGSFFVDARHPHLTNAAGSKTAAVSRQSFAFLDAVFLDGALVVSEAAGVVHAVVTATGEDTWTYRPPAGEHVLRLGYHHATKRVLAIQWPYAHGGGKKLVALAAHNGSLLDEIHIGNPVDCTFAQSGAVLATTDELLFDTVTGQRIPW